MLIITTSARTCKAWGCIVHWVAEVWFLHSFFISWTRTLLLILWLVFAFCSGCMCYIMITKKILSKISVLYLLLTAWKYDLGPTSRQLLPYYSSRAPCGRGRAFTAECFFVLWRTKAGAEPRREGGTMGGAAAQGNTLTGQQFYMGVATTTAYKFCRHIFLSG